MNVIVNGDLPFQGLNACQRTDSGSPESYSNSWSYTNTGELVKAFLPYSPKCIKSGSRNQHCPGCYTPPLQISEPLPSIIITGDITTTINGDTTTIISKRSR